MTVRKRNTKYLRRFGDVVEKIAKKHGLSSEDVEGIVDHFFHTFHLFITDPRMPKIKITYFGSFTPRKSKIEWHIRRAVKGIVSGKYLERNRGKIKHLLQIRQRLKRENRGEITWKEWRDRELNINYTKKGKNAKK